MSITEYMTLVDALDKGLVHDMVEFYYISRSILCKNEHLFDIYDIAFANFFKEASLKFPEEIKEVFWKWLQKEESFKQESISFGEFFENLDLDTLREELRRLLKQQDKEHNFGEKWIGTQGQSRFGNAGQNLIGMRIGGDYGMHRALKIAQKREFRDYRKDIVLDTRQVKIALKRLRRLDDIGKKSELNIEKTIKETGQNGGDLEFIFEKRKKNNVKLILMTDVGGTMDPYIHRVNLLFSAASSMSHWRNFKHFYFHNCIYDHLYDDAKRHKERAMAFTDFLRKYDSSYRIVIVGDQCMHRSELANQHGAIYDDASNDKPGIYYIEKIAEHFENHVVWLNPETTPGGSWTQLVISKIIPTFTLTIEGIEDAMDYLKMSGKNKFTTVELLRGMPLAAY